MYRDKRAGEGEPYGESMKRLSVAVLLVLILPMTAAAKTSLPPPKHPTFKCPKLFTQKQHEHYARTIFARDEITRKAYKRNQKMRLCQHSAKASKNALKLTRKLRKRREDRLASYQYSSGGGSPIPQYIVECESGGSYNAVNPTSGAYGKYQIMPFHWSSGVCQGLDKSPRGQDECAARIWNSSGPGAWECA